MTEGPSDHELIAKATGRSFRPTGRNGYKTCSSPMLLFVAGP